MILPQIVPSHSAPNWNTWRLNSAANLANDTAGGSSFEQLLNARVISLSGSGSPEATAESDVKSADPSNLKGADSAEEQVQQNATADPAIAFGATSGSLLLRLPGLIAAQGSSTSVSFGASYAPERNTTSINVAGAGKLGVRNDAAVSGTLGVYFSAPLFVFSATALSGAAKSGEMANGTGPSTPAGLQQLTRTSEPTELAASALPALPPAFTLDIRAESGQHQSLAHEQQLLGQNTLEPATAPQMATAPQSAENASDSNPVPTPQSQASRIFPIIPPQGEATQTGVTSSDELPSSQENAPAGNNIDTAGNTIPGQAVTKTDFAGTSPDGKFSDDQPAEKQCLISVLESAASPGAGPTELRESQPRIATEYVQHSDQLEDMHPETPVTDIRLQIDGLANQHVNVRLVQQADGLRVSVGSSDPALTQSLQERIPELTARLEQHHYQTDVLLPGHNDPAHVNLSSSASNLQEDSAGHKQGSAGQGSSGQSSAGQGNQKNKQLWRQQTAASDEENFSSLLI